MAKRVLLFLLTNFLVVLTVGIVLHVLGVRPWLDARGIDYRALLAFCLVWGMAGAMVSLALSRFMAIRAMGVQVIDPATSDPLGRQLLQKVELLARSAELPMPQVGVFHSDAINAFATGPTRNRSIVAVSSGLLRKMDGDEADGVLGHEISHIANGDMVTMALLQGVVNAFVMFLARAIGFAMMRRDSDEGFSFGAGSYLLIMALEMVFMVLGSIVVMAFSRYREFHADAGSARIAGRHKMIAALQRLQRDLEAMRAEPTPPSVRAMMISDKPGFARLFASHPPLEERIARLQSGA
jgi:heat shock protein HtpX